MGSRLRFESFSLLHQGIAVREFSWEDVSIGHILDTPDHYFPVVVLLFMQFLLFSLLCNYFYLQLIVLFINPISFVYIFLVGLGLKKCPFEFQIFSFRVQYNTAHIYNKTKLIQYILKIDGQPPTFRELFASSSGHRCSELLVGRRLHRSYLGYPRPLFSCSCVVIYVVSSVQPSL